MTPAHFIIRLMLGGLVFSPSLLVAAQPVVPIPFGANTVAGHFLQVGDAKIYYEIYGGGHTPLIMLHGGLYGYIDEYGDLIQKLSQDRQVIAIATRGHGKSTIGLQDFSFQLFADDALAVIRKETREKVDVVGFSDGAVTAYLLASEHPEIVRRLVAIGGPRGTQDWTEKARKEFAQSKPSDIAKNDPQFVTDRKKLMSEPQRWEEFVARIDKVEGQARIITDQQLQSIREPTLVIAGDRDPYNENTKFLEIFHLLPRGQLMIIPGCGHLVLYHEPALTNAAIERFLDQPNP